MSRLLIVEDEQSIATELKHDLELEDYEVVTSSDGQEALDLVRRGGFDLMVLDRMLPGKDGFEVCRELRRSGSRIPIIMLTDRTSEAERCLGLDLGADDYLTRPFSPMELRARIKAVLRRSRREDAPLLRFGVYELDQNRFELRIGDEVVHLTPLEYRLLITFTRHPGRVLSRDRLLDLVWGPDTFITDRLVDTHIANLRKKIESDTSAPVHIVSIRGMGYRFDP
jgi:DNA-binding response OmpR family regulator